MTRAKPVNRDANGNAARPFERVSINVSATEFGAKTELRVASTVFREVRGWPFDFVALWVGLARHRTFDFIALWHRWSSHTPVP